MGLRSGRNQTAKPAKRPTALPPFPKPFPPPFPIVKPDKRQLAPPFAKKAGFPMPIPKTAPFAYQPHAMKPPLIVNLPNSKLESSGGNPIIINDPCRFNNKQQFSKPTCANDLNETDFSRVAFLSGLDVATVRQLWKEFLQLTGGRGKLERNQYRNIFIKSLYHVAMQNLETLAEETFRAFDKDSNGNLDFFDFIAAYKSNSPHLKSVNAQLGSLGIG
ncbi:hypothetical protein GJ496_003745 [Pomphorhynchus laevis]|nr:hypothetical protein GJ496_003745 [Pomphorhynchus laevis]